MKNLNIRHRFYPLLLALAFLFSACSSSGTLQEFDRENSLEDVTYSIIYLIHGDADYLYHDSLGRARQADKEVLKEAMRVGKNAKQGEVFIFHQRPERKVLWIFPKKDRRFMYYRNGELISEKQYSPPAEAAAGVFSAEARLYRESRSATDTMENSVLLYFGHEIPYENGAGYYHSLSGKAMNTNTFSTGIRTLLPKGREHFDLTVLSTCNNGSPDMVRALKSVTRYLLASPQNLHLSHIDTEGLSLLENETMPKAREVADKLSRDSFRRLTKTVQTVVSLSIYDMQEVDGYIDQVNSTYQTYLETGSAADPGSDNVDCTDLSIFEKSITFSKGVSVRYRPPRFGLKAQPKSHSGWGCKRRES